MENQTISMRPQQSSDTFSNKNIVIIILIVLLIITTLGVNIIYPLTNIIQSGLIFITNFIRNIMGSVLHNTGEIVNASTEVVSNTAKTTIDLGAGAVVDAGNLLKGVGSNVGSIDNVINKSSEPPADPNPTPSENTVQQSIQSGNKSSWCLVGNYSNKNSCVEIDKSLDKCMSEKIFPSKEKCLILN
jgi:hypothetical protein